MTMIFILEENKKRPSDTNNRKGKRYEIEGTTEMVRKRWSESDADYTSCFKELTSKPSFIYLANRVFETVPHGAYLLEVGAGFCWLSTFFLKKGYKVVATDINLDNVAGLKACQWFNNHFNTNVRMVCHDAEVLPFSADSFEGVVGRELLHHLFDIDKAVAEFERVLKPGGVAIFSTEHTTVPLVPGKFFYRYALGGGESLDHGRNEHPRRLGEYVRAFEKAGFKEIEVTPKNGWEGFFNQLRKEERGIKKIIGTLLLHLPRAFVKNLLLQLGGITINIFARKPGGRLR